MYVIFPILFIFTRLWVAFSCTTITKYKYNFILVLENANYLYCIKFVISNSMNSSAWKYICKSPLIYIIFQLINTIIEFIPTFTRWNLYNKYIIIVNLYILI